VTYGFDEIALVPGRVTINPNEIKHHVSFARQAAEPLELKIPILASAMDGVVMSASPSQLKQTGRTFAVLNLEGVQTRLQEPAGGPAKNRRSE